MSCCYCSSNIFVILVSVDISSNFFFTIDICLMCWISSCSKLMFFLSAHFLILISHFNITWLFLFIKHIFLEFVDWLDFLIWINWLFCWASTECSSNLLRSSSGVFRYSSHFCCNFFSLLISNKTANC
jgi:hypothetical protein